MDFLKPIVTFFGKLSFKKKIGVMIITVVVPFLIPSYFTYKTFYEELNSIEKEQRALKFIYPLKELIKLIQQHRGMMQSYLEGEKAFEKNIKENEKKAEALFLRLKNLEKKLGTDTIISKSIKDIQKLYSNLKLNNIEDNEKSFKLHTRLVSKLINLKKDIANSFGINQDKNINNHYLIVSLFDTLPNIQEYVGKIRGHVAGVLTKENIKDSEIENIQNFITILFSEMSTLTYAMTHYIQNRSDVQELEKEFGIMKKRVKNYLDTVEGLIYKREQMAPRKFFSYATNVIDNIDTFYNLLLQRFELDLQKRKSEIFRDIILLTLGLLLVVLMVFYLFLGFFFSINRPLEEFKKAIKKFSTGDYSTSLNIKTDDEMREISEAFNTMAVQINRQINFLKWYQIALDSATLVTKSDKKGFITYANEAFLKRTGYKIEDILRKPHNIFRHPDMPKDLFEDMWKTILSKKMWKGVLKIRTKYGEDLIMKTSIVPIIDEKGEIQEFVAVRVDITDLIRAQEKIKRMLYHDTLTSLPNRTKLIEDIKNKRAYSVIIINIDDFRQLNDIYGYEAGNFVLKESAKILKLFEQNSWSVYRLPSDEFAFISFKKRTKDEVLKFARNLIKKLEDNIFTYKEYEIKILLKAGIALIENDSKDIEKILLDADTSIKEAKKYSDKIVYFDESKSAKVEYKHTLERVTKIKKAIEEDRIVPYFQPIYNNKTKKIEKYEALVRLIDEDGTAISPFFFLDIAKRAKLYTKITKIMIEKSFKAFENRCEELSLNISTQDLVNPDIVKFIENKLEEYNMKKRAIFENSEQNKLLNCSGVVIEITETEEVENYDIVAKFIQKIKNFGGKVAIDDFGSGYSNFVYILNMGIDYLKIDASLIKNILHDEKSETLVKAIIHFSKELGIKTIAEFVSEEDIQQKVEDIGVDYSQGFYIGKPLPIEELPPYVQ